MKYKEVNNLIIRAKDGDKEAKERLWLERVKRIAVNIAKQKNARQNMEDVIQECYIRFEGTLRTNKHPEAFLSQVRRAMKGLVLNYIGKNTTALNHAKDTVALVGEYKNQCDEGESSYQIMETMNIKKEKLDELEFIRVGVVELDAPIGDGVNSRTYAEMIEDKNNDLNEIEQEINCRYFLEELKINLSSKEYIAIYMRIQNPDIVDREIAEVIGDSASYASRIRKSAQKKAQKLFVEFYGYMPIDKKSPLPEGLNKKFLQKKII